MINGPCDIFGDLIRSGDVVAWPHAGGRLRIGKVSEYNPVDGILMMTDTREILCDKDLVILRKANHITASR